MRTAINVKDLSKVYQLGEIGTGTVSRDLERWWRMTILRQEDPFLMIGETNDRSIKGSSKIVYSLRDVNFEIEQGDTVGIIGKNGAGKSTLLKILSRVTSPSTGKIMVKGRIASLLEVGTGFHPELTGLENIFLNGAILGMRKKEISRKLDEIVDFSGVERFLDTPVKRYSSGMYVRLAFAVAAHLESEILIVDEVLAVGDAEFQKKCLGKMDDISKSQGRTILFVSHNMSAIQNLCKKGMLLEKGAITSFESVHDVINRYSKISSEELSQVYSAIPDFNKPVQIIDARVVNPAGEICQYFDISEEIVFLVKIRCTDIPPTLFGYLTIKNAYEEIIVQTDTHDFPPNCMQRLLPGMNEFALRVRDHVLAHGEYKVDFYLGVDFGRAPAVDNAGEILRFVVSDAFTRRGDKRISKTSCLIEWKKSDPIGAQPEFYDQ